MASNSRRAVRFRPDCPFYYDVCLLAGREDTLLRRPMGCHKKGFICYTSVMSIYKKGFINIFLVVMVITLVGIGGYFIFADYVTAPTIEPTPAPLPDPTPLPPPVFCTQEAKLCPDGSYVGRTGPNCEFSKCPANGSSTTSECTKDSDCPSPSYTCEATQGYGTVCSSNDLSCEPTYTITAGECKLKAGMQCRVGSDCASGNLCNRNICVSPIGRQCLGPSDKSCSTGFECVQGCGPPVARENDPPPPYYCQLKGYNRPCPICLAEGARIDTPAGAVAVQDLKNGMLVWTTDIFGKRVALPILETSRTPVPATHYVVHVILSDGRELFVSPGHPTGDGRFIRELSVGDMLDGGRVIFVQSILYKNAYTYDLLTFGPTGNYFANGILIGSTLFQFGLK